MGDSRHPSRTAQATDTLLYSYQLYNPRQKLGEVGETTNVTRRQVLTVPAASKPYSNQKTTTCNSKSLRRALKESNGKREQLGVYQLPIS